VSAGEPQSPAGRGGGAAGDHGAHGQPSAGRGGGAAGDHGAHGQPSAGRGGGAAGDLGGYDVRELLSAAVAAARLGGGLLRERFEHGEPHGVASKSTPTDLVSEADLASEHAIRELLGELRPADGFVGEEGDEDLGSSGLRWVVDPLDGTVNFLFGIPQWCVSVAVKHGEQTLVGAIYNPCREELFTSVYGAQAHLHEGRGEHAHGSRVERVLSGPARRELPMAMVATGFAYDARVRAAQGDAIERLLPRVRDIRRFGSAALDLAWTAAGRYDAYFERSVKQWDIAAGVLMCEAAGLQVRELPEQENLPWGILVAPPALCEPLLELVAGA
jgi:myo-inositol-1(or 4)-monophosphatase